MAKSHAKQTLTQELDLKASLIGRIQQLESMLETLWKHQKLIVENQQRISQQISTISKTNTKDTTENILIELREMKKQNRTLKKQLVVVFLMVLVPLLAASVGCLLAWGLSK